MTRDELEEDPTVEVDPEVIEQHMKGLLGRLQRRRPTPTRLGRYAIGEELGRGGMGTVYAAVDEDLGRGVAIKLLHGEVGSMRARRLVREAQALARLSHPNVVQVYEVGEEDGRWFIAMELVEGQTLRQWQAERPPWDECVRVYLQAGRGLAAAHAAGLTHRDFKPDNCIIDDGGRVRVLDFGLVRGEDETLDDGAPGSAEWEERLVGLTKTGTLLGTPGYMSLEQLRAGTAGPSSDLFALCVCLYEAVYGEAPFEGKTIGERMRAVEAQRIRPASPQSSVPVRLRRVLLRGLAAEPEQRWSSMERLLAALEHVVEPRRRRWRWGVGLASVVAIAGVGLLLSAGGSRCEGLGAELAGTWDDERREALRSAMLRSVRAHGPETWGWVEDALDRRAQEWTEARTEACEASHEREGPSPRVLATQAACLDEVRVELAATVEALTRAEPAVVDRAVAVLGGLPSASRCADGSALRAKSAVPPGEASAVARAWALLAEAGAEHRGGRPDAARGRLDEADRALEGISHGPVLVRKELLEGQVLAASGALDSAEAALGRAMVLAARWRRWDDAYEAALGTMDVLARRGRAAEALRHRELVRGLAADDPRAQARVADVLARIHEAEGRMAEAEAEHRRALELRRAALGPDHPEVVRTLGRLAACLDARGNHEAAAAAVHEARRIGEVSLGPWHPWVAELPVIVDATASG